MRILISFALFALLFTAIPASANDLEQEVLFVNCGDDRQLIIDTTGHQYYAALNNVLLERLHVPQTDSSWQEVPPELLPKSLRMGSVDLLTEHKSLQAKITSSRIKYGASETQLILITDQECDHRFRGGLVKLGPPVSPSAHLNIVEDPAFDMVGSARGQCNQWSNWKRSLGF